MRPSCRPGRRKRQELPAVSVTAQKSGTGQRPSADGPADQAAWCPRPAQARTRTADHRVRRWPRSLPPQPAGTQRLARAWTGRFRGSRGTQATDRAVTRDHQDTLIPLGEPGIVDQTARYEPRVPVAPRFSRRITRQVRLAKTVTQLLSGRNCTSTELITWSASSSDAVRGRAVTGSLQGSRS